MPDAVISAWIVYYLGTLAVIGVFVLDMYIPPEGVRGPFLGIAWDCYPGGIAGWIATCLLVSVGIRRGWAIIWFVQIGIVIFTWAYVMSWKHYVDEPNIFSLVWFPNLLVQSVILLFWFRFDVRDWFGLGWYWPWQSLFEDYD